MGPSNTGIREFRKRHSRHWRSPNTSTTSGAAHTHTSTHNAYVWPTGTTSKLNKKNVHTLWHTSAWLSRQRYSNATIYHTETQRARGRHVPLSVQYHCTLHKECTLDGVWLRRVVVGRVALVWWLRESNNTESQTPPPPPEPYVFRWRLSAHN